MYLQPVGNPETQYWQIDTARFSSCPVYSIGSHIFMYGPNMECELFLESIDQNLATLIKKF